MAMHILHFSHPKVTSIVNKSQRARKKETEIKRIRGDNRQHDFVSDYAVKF